MVSGRKDWSGATALVTGASRGLGSVLAIAFAKRGLHLVLAARDAKKLEGVAKECEAAAPGSGSGAPVRIIEADVSVAAERHALLEACGPVDVLVNNAGIEIAVALADQTEADIDAQVATNLVAPIALTKLFLPAMIARRSGVVVNVSSMSGKSSTPFNSIYAATKHGINGFSSSLRVELTGTGVHVGVVCPSFVANSGMWADTGLKAPAMMREVSPDAFVKAVFAVMNGKAEVLVTPGPVRPLLALRELVPGLDAVVLEKMGVMRALRDRASRGK